MRGVARIINAVLGRRHWRRVGAGSVPEDGMYVSALGVLHVQGDTAELALSCGARHSVRMLSQGNGVAVDTVCTPTQQGTQLQSMIEFPLVQADRARALFGATVTSWQATLMHRPTARRGGVGWFLGGVLCGAALLTAFGLMTAPSNAGKTADARWTAPEAGLQPAENSDTVARLQQARLAAQEMQRVQQAHRVELREGHTPLVAFSDPNCSACRELEREAAALAAGTGFAVIPVGFQPGSRALVARVLCSEDPVRAWTQAIKGTPPQAQPCEDGLRKVEENNALFASVGASATPTLVAANGQMAQGTASAAQLEVFAASYAR